MGAMQMGSSWREEAAELREAPGRGRAELRRELRVLALDLMNLADPLIAFRLRVLQPLGQSDSRLGVLKAFAERYGGAQRVHIHRHRRSSSIGFVLAVPAMQGTTIGRRCHQASCREHQVRKRIGGSLCRVSHVFSSRCGGGLLRFFSGFLFGCLNLHLFRRGRRVRRRSWNVDRTDETLILAIGERPVRHRPATVRRVAIKAACSGFPFHRALCADFAVLYCFSSAGKNILDNIRLQLLPIDVDYPLPCG
mmetsp:Transcript_82341/g.197474  ORF Transcript_82341/g.197474 Transcript_82341/m.197474 type:complete len:251 (-) Transcript_82341:102-854(-)